MKMRGTSRGPDKKPGGKNDQSFHPHGNASIYDALSRMIRDYINHIPLIEGQGNHGAIDGSPAAAERYTEARLARDAEWLVLDGVGEGAVPTVSNYDESRMEPALLPVKLPMLLLNGVPSGSIGVGFASSIPPHNPTELARAALLAIRVRAARRELTVAEVLAVMPGPDLPTGGILGSPAEIAEVYRTGQGSLRLRASASIVDGDIVVTAIPYEETTEGIVADIGEAALGRRDLRTKARGTPQIPEVRNVRDETVKERGTGRLRVRLVIELKQGEDPDVVLEKLYRHTKLQVVMSVNLTALDVDRQPQVYSVPAVLAAWAAFREECVRRLASGRLERVRGRQHVLEGLLLALPEIDAVVRAVRSSPNDDATVAALRALLGVTTRQAEAIASMELRRLNGLRSEAMRGELVTLEERAQHLLLLLTDPAAVAEEICGELEEAIRRFPAARKTRITQLGEQDARSLVVPGEALVTVTGRGYLRRIVAADFRAQHRGGRGKRGVRVKTDDVLHGVTACHSHDRLFAFTDSGRVARLEVHEVPEGEGGRHAVNLGLADGELVAAALAAPWPLPDVAEVVLASDTGKVKRVALLDLSSRMTKVMNLYRGTKDETIIGAVLLPGGEGEVFLASSRGLGTRFTPGGVPLSKRDSGGVRGMDLPEGVRLVSLGRIVNDRQLLLCISSNGWGKRVASSQFPVQVRGGKGRILMKLHERVTLVAALVVNPDDDVLVASRKGMTTRVNVSEIRELGRSAMGSRVIDLAEGDEVVAAAILPSDVEG
jgi:DNA gyrase subunit A